MPLTADDILSRASKVVQDTTNVRWPFSELVLWLNDGQREIVLHRPDANPVTAFVTLAAGTRQKLTAANTSSDPAKLLDVICNHVSATSKRTTGVRLVQREVLDSQTVGWHAATAATVIKHFTIDPRDPLAFYVYPASDGNSRVEVLFSAYPADVTTGASSIGVPDIYGNALLDYVLYRAYSKDSEYAGNAQRAQFHYSAFANSLNIELKATLLMTPMVSGATWNPNTVKPSQPAGR